MKSFLHGRPVQKGSLLHSLSGQAPEFSGKAHVAGHSSESGPTVECIKEGDKVVRMVVTCTCGERIEIECLYPAGG
ncbi:MAG: hypothetical protein WC378_05825 [Opitutaceae bacterium]|jgi:hypothetical protein